VAAEQPTLWHGAANFRGKQLVVRLLRRPRCRHPPSAVDARPAFQMVIYPGYTSLPDGRVPESIAPTAEVPPTFLVQAENDYSAHVESSVYYFMALKNAKVPAELHIYTQGGHGFGLRPTEFPIAATWPKLAETWLHTIHVLGPPGPVGRP